MDRSSQFVLIAKRILRELGALTQTVRTGFSEVRNEIKTIQRNYKANDNKEKQGLPIESWPDAPLPLPVAIREYYEAEQSNRNSRWEKIKKPLEIVGVFAAVVIAFFTISTFRQVKRQADAAERAVRLEQRASLGIRTGNPILFDGKPIVMPLQIFNNGKTTARNINGLVDVTLRQTVTDEMQERRSDSSEGDIHYGAMFAGDSQPFPGVIIENGKPVEFTTEVKRRMDAGELKIETFGRITYSDSFGDHWTQFCFLAGKVTCTNLRFKKRHVTPTIG